MNRRASLKILLVQIRQDIRMIPAERMEFVSFSGLGEHQIITLDVFRDPDFSPLIVDDFDALFIGGLSDDRSDQVELPATFQSFLSNLNDLILRAIHQKVPALLSCGGFMLASMLLGAKVVVDPGQAELDVVDIFLTREAISDPLFQHFPDTFGAVSGHIKSTIDLPEKCVLLAYSKRCEVHGFKVAGCPFYTFQFHPEITCADLQARVMAYKDKYFKSDDHYREFIKMNCDTSVANAIIGRFVDLISGAFRAGE
ncbi:MAG: hypothetical protein KDC80_20795 [Saprospiraceae bacterium]|nr:hypothetical protein [Saprospiraceae bacterium]